MYQRDVLFDRLLLAGFDAIAVFGTALLAVWLRHSWGVGGPVTVAPWSAYMWPALLVTVALVVALAASGLYQAVESRRTELIKIAKVTAVTTMAVLAISFFFRGYSYSRATVAIFFVLAVPALVGTRALHRYLQGRLRSGADAGRRVAIVGTGPTGRRLGDALLDDPAYYTLVGFIKENRHSANGSLNGLEILGDSGELRELVLSHDIDEILLAESSVSIERQQELIGACMEVGVRWRLVPNLAGLLHDRVEVDSVGGLPVVGLRGSRVVGYNWTLKRAFDVTLAAASGLILLPLMVAIALSIKLTSWGPVLYRQSRVGLRGRYFTMLKFRTMYINSDADVHQTYATDWIFGRTGHAPSLRGRRPGFQNAGAVHKMLDDPRVTAVGRFLRATSLDELPQLWNVMRGEMSIVGPRPPLPYEVERYTEAHKRRFEALPGITGLWQVSGRNHLSFEDMVRLDISYIENWSLGQDVRIVLRTIPALVTDRGH